MCLDDIALKIRQNIPSGKLPPGNSDELFLIYAVLLRCKGSDVTCADVHDAWSAWMAKRVPGHASLVAYDSLPKAVPDEDGVFNEVLQIRSSQLDLKRCKLVLNGNQRVCSRRIPICLDLSRELRLYLRGSLAEDASDCTIFASISGQPLTNSYLTARFQRLLQAADITRSDGIRRSPRMRDFRASFAVHRLETWIKEGGNLDRFLPSLSTYMGYSSLCAARKYLRFAPDHLRAHIAKLSEPSSTAMDAIITSVVKASPER